MVHRAEDADDVIDVTACRLLLNLLINDPEIGGALSVPLPDRFSLTLLLLAEFMHPVAGKIPGYEKIVRKPMDISTVEVCVFCVVLRSSPRPAHPA